MLMPAFAYDTAQIIKWLGASTVAKARGYVDEVRHLHWDNDVLRADVKGTQRQPYHVEVKFRDDRGAISAQGRCSCPVGFGCKHAAAALLATASDKPEEPDSVRAEVAGWLEGFRSRFASTRSTAAKKTTEANGALALAYVLGTSRVMRMPEVALHKVRLSPDGSLQTLDRPWTNLDSALVKQPKFVSDDDLTILRALIIGRTRNDFGGFALHGEEGADLLQRMLATGRLFTATPSSRDVGEPRRPLTQGEARPGRIEWTPDPDDRVRPVLQTEPASTFVITTEPLWFADAETREAGIVDMPQPARQLVDYLAMPPISLAEAPLVGAMLREVASDLPPPPGHETLNLQIVDIEPVPVLVLDTQSISGTWRPREERTGASVLDFALLSFDYSGFSIDPTHATTILRTESGDMVQVKRRHDVETRYSNQLYELGFRKIPAHQRFGPKAIPAGVLGLPASAAWALFTSDTVPSLREDGWRISMSPEFRFDFIEIDDIQGTAHHSTDGWFDLELGIAVGERSVRLEPLLADLFQRDRRWLAGAIDSIPDDEGIELNTDLGERLRLRASRIKPVVRVLIDLFDTLGTQPLRVSEKDAGRLEALTDTGRWQFHGDVSIRELAQRLQEGPGLREVPVPRGLNAELRVYQREGLNWMQYLRERNLSGVLADDMGLGKTVQTLAHILVEKESGRLDRPALVVLPTTLVHNWREEAKKFAPDLRVLDLHGPQRKDRFDQISEHDLVLTTYPLLWRDLAMLSLYEYHLLILDEAQTVKNVATKAAKGIRDLSSRHRLCLTGTPLENHLGELWAQFDFLLPGFLGTQKDFTKRWRTPIEKYEDPVRRDLLVRRIRPFMLRRRKDEVAKELPQKTTIVRTVSLEGSQRDLYETVRIAMQEKVRMAVADQGLARSHIVVLEALLKLRQVCCDPSLVKLTRAKRVEESAKLDLLLDMLPELLEEGRRVLLFSQFTGMLAIIAAALDEAGLPYVTLTGDTRDRVTPVTRFQDGEVPLFLISLKAGGVGLNLTAADTVIHYDPWWNPAAENQATDRAHRLGQLKPVFVYKLIVAGSIEERIVAMQDRKAALADSILREDAVAGAKFSAEDIEALLAPMPQG
ncbi:DEAD/DEAH box helicase [Burkholderia sp. PAMC 28687]|uniref:DEAD/DEAH box helicase n=1 Tax=Burkholderia sp. PAMC 28687 TaxID=1795874 RepID=UPI000A85A80E